MKNTQSYPTQTLLTLVKRGKIDKESALLLLQAFQQDASKPEANKDDSIAIIGMSCRLPGAEDPHAFWINLSQGVDHVGAFPENRRKDTDVLLPEDMRASPDVYCDGGYLQEISLFDHELFGIPKEEADLMDPQHRIFMEVVHAALEDAAYAGQEDGPRNVGVFVGNSASEYHKFLTRASERAVTGNASPFLCGRVSFHYNFSGPCMMVNTACSSSLVAIHLACQALIQGDCTMALAGGITLFPFPVNDEHDIWRTVGITSGDNKCRSFDDAASGAVRGEGAGVIVLKRLSKALADHDHIHAVIKGTAVNQDGHSNGMTSPNPLAQADVIARAWERGGIDPCTIGYIETHGTGTRLGDPIEVAGLTMAFERYTDRKQFCAIGSLKTNIGHLSDGAAGVAGVIKAVLMFANRKLPPSIHFSCPNALIQFPATPVYVNDRLSDWTDETLRAGISGFGLSGTNCHIVLEEPPAIRRSVYLKGQPSLLTVSAATYQNLLLNVQALARYMERTQEELVDICYSASLGRPHQSHRIAFVADDKEMLSTQLSCIRSVEDVMKPPLKGVYSGVKEKRHTYVQPADVLQMTPPEIARLYALGAEIDWVRYYKGTEAYRTPLPAYARCGVRCWREGVLKDVVMRPVSNSQPKQQANEAKPYDKARAQDLSQDFLLLCRYILGRDDVELEDDFFEMGGTSLKIVDLANELANRYGCYISIGEIFEASRLSEMLVLLRDTPAGEQETIPKAAQQSAYPLSHAQKRIFFMNQMDIQSIAYNLNGAVRLRGALDLERFKQSVAQLVDIHEAFRTSFLVQKRQVVQIVQENVDLKIGIRDLSMSGREIAIEKAIQSCIVPFDLTKAPLLRIALMKTGQEEHYMIFDMHHIISDGTSLGLLVKHFAALYNGDFLPHPPITYKDFTIWQEQWDERARTEQKDYWASVFSTIPSALNLPYDYPRDDEVDYSGATVRGHIDEKTYKGVLLLARSCNTSLTTVLLGAFYVLLTKQTQQDDLVIGLLSAGRTRPELQEVIGMFVNTLAIRNQPLREKTVACFLGEVHNSVAGALKNQDYQFDELIADLKISTPLNRNALFDVAFVMQNMHYPDLELKGLDAQPIITDTHTAQFDIRLEAWEEADGVRINMEYKTSLFKEDTVQALLERYLSIVSSMVTMQDATIAQLTGD